METRKKRLKTRQLLLLGILLSTWGAGVYGALVGSKTPATLPEREILPVALDNISGLAWDGEHLWITSEGAEKIVAVDPESGAITREIPFPIAATGGSAWDGTSLWQLAYAERKIYQIDRDSGTIRGSIKAPGQGICSGMTFDGSHFWLANPDEKKLFRIDREGAVVAVYPGLYETTGLAWDGRHLWSGVLVGTTADHDAPPPKSGFVQEQDLETGTTERVLPVAGVFAGSTDWTPAQPTRARRMWWYDGHHGELVAFTFNPAGPNLQLMGWLVALLGTVNLLAGGWLLTGLRAPHEGAP